MRRDDPWKGVAVTDARTLVSSSVAAGELGVHYSALSRWAAEGRVTPAARTAGGHLRWDMPDLRRQLRANEESAALDPLRHAYTAACAVINGMDDLHAALAVVVKIVATLQALLEAATAQRAELVQRIYQQDGLALKPLADEVSISQARAQREGR